MRSPKCRCSINGSKTQVSHGSYRARVVAPNWRICAPWRQPPAAPGLVNSRRSVRLPASIRLVTRYAPRWLRLGNCRRRGPPAMRGCVLRPLSPLRRRRRGRHVLASLAQPPMSLLQVPAVASACRRPMRVCNRSAGYPLRSAAQNWWSAAADVFLTPPRVATTRSKSRFRLFEL